MDPESFWFHSFIFQRDWDGGALEEVKDFPVRQSCTLTFLFIPLTIINGPQKVIRILFKSVSIAFSHSHPPLSLPNWQAAAAEEVSSFLQFSMCLLKCHSSCMKYLLQSFSQSFLRCRLSHWNWNWTRGKKILLFHPQPYLSPPPLLQAVCYNHSIRSRRYCSVTRPLIESERQEERQPLSCYWDTSKPFQSVSMIESHPIQSGTTVI